MPNHCLHIAIIAFHTCPLADTEGLEIGGMNTYVYEQAKALAKLGHLVDVFTRIHGANLSPIENICTNLRIIHLSAGENKHFPPSRLNPYIEEFTEHLKAFINTHSLVYDVFHSHYYLSGLVALKINDQQHQQTPLVMSFHTMGLMKNLIARGIAEQENIQRIDAELMLTKKADQIIVNCEAEKKYLEFLYQTDVKKISVITPGVNTDLFNKQQPRQESSFTKVFRLLFVGRIQALKGIDNLLYALKIISKKHPNQFSLLIMGSHAEEIKNNPEMKILDTMIKQLNINAEIEFLTQRSPKELAFVYQQSNVLILPSYYETFGLVALESMACGVPAIVTENCGVAELMRKHIDAPFVIPAANPLALALSIEELFTQIDSYPSRSENVYTFAQTYTWQKNTQELVGSYHSTINALKHS